MKLIHTGDFHLDARMETGLAPARARERRQELLFTFSRLITFAEEKNVSAILIAGDLFDTERATISTRRYVGEAIAAHPAIRFLMINGNHDENVAPLFPDKTPANYYTFPRDRWGSVDLDAHTVVSGISDVGIPGIFKDLPAPQSTDNSPLFHIVLLHGEISDSSHESPNTIPRPLLRGHGISYVALGHEHSAKIEFLEPSAHLCYAGCPEGRGYDECGEKGFLLLDTELPPDMRVKFCPFASRTLHDLLITVDGVQTFGEITERVMNAISALPDKDMVKVTLTGSLASDVLCDFDMTLIEKVLTDRFFGARCDNQVKLRICPEDYVNDISLKGEFIRQVLATRMSEEEKSRVILCGLRALRGEEVDE